MAVADDDHGGEHDTLPSWNIVVICTVGGVLMLEFLTHQMNAAAKGKKHAMELLEGLYRELAILGVVAFVLWSINVSEYVTIEYNDKHLFEQIHMTLFLAALFHSFPIGMVVLYSKQTTRRWDLFEDDEMRRYKDLKQQYRRTAAKLGLRHSQLKRGVGIFKWACLLASHPMLCRRLSELSEHVSYHALRCQFIKNNQLPKNFRFAAYLKKCEQEVVIGLAEIKHGVWVGLILFVGVELYVKGIMGKATSNADGRGLFLLAAALVIFAALAVHFKLRSIYSAMVDSYRPSAERKDDLAQYLGPDAAAQIIQQDMFWFGKPHLLLTALQTMQFVLAVMVSALIWFGAGESKGLVIVAEMLLAAGAFAIYIVVLPKFIPRFTQVTHIGGMVNRNILSETLLKQKNSFQRRTLPPTLRQISAMARLKSSEAQENGKFMVARKLMSGQAFREVMKVMVGVHFFVVAYNTDQVKQNGGDGGAWVAEMVLAGIALLVEISTHFIVWRGMACFHLNPFVEVPTRMVNTPYKPAAAIYPSSSRRQLLGGESNGSPKASTGHDLEFGRSSASASARRETHRVCSVWACFGWRGGDYVPAEGDGLCGCLNGVPSQSVVGAWRTLDLFLVLVVLGCSIATGLVDGVSRVVVHAIQGIVVLRLWPLWRCPFPAAFGHETILNVDGSTVHLAPLDNRTLESVMQETLSLLRRQNPQEGTFEARALMDETLNDAMTDKDRAKHLHNPSTDTLTPAYNGTQGTIAEAKDEDNDSEHDTGGSTDGVANVGVAMALQQAFTAHPDLVQSQGPLCVPILRAILGLDPHKTTPQDDAKAFAIAARAVTLARSHSRTEEDVSRSSNPVVRRAIPRSRSSSVEVAPPTVLSSPSSSDLSDGDTYDGAGRSVLGNSQHEGGKRGRISSFLSGSRHSWKKNTQHSHHRQHPHEQQQQLFYQQQEQQLLYQQQMHVQMMQQQQQQQQQQLQYQQYQLGHNFTSTDLASVSDYQGRPPYAHDTAQDTLRMLRSEHRGEFMTSHSIPIGGHSEVMRHTPFDPFTPAAAGSISSVRRGASVRSSNSALHSYSRHSRRVPHGSNTSDNTGGTVPPAFEDLERAVVPSVVSTTSSQYSTGNGTGRVVRRSASGSGVGNSGLLPAGRVPYSSGRSVPQSSGHHSVWRGTPARGLKGPATSTHDRPLMPPDGERTAPLQSQGATGTGGGGGSGGGGDTVVDGCLGNDSREGVDVRGGSPGSACEGDAEETAREVRTSDATASVSRASTTAQTSTTPSTHLGSIDAFQPNGNNAE